MAKIWSDKDGAVIRFDDYDSAGTDPAPKEFTYYLEFDETTNKDLVEAILGGISLGDSEKKAPGVLVDGKLTVKGKGLSVNPPSAEALRRKQRDADLATLAAAAADHKDEAVRALARLVLEKLP